MNKIIYVILLNLFIFASIANCDIKSLMESMTVEEKIGQLFMVGGLQKGCNPEELFGKYHFGNIFLSSMDIGKKNPAEIAELTNSLQALAEKYNRAIPLLVATDQEGGKVNRIRKGAVVYPAQDYIGSKTSLKQAENIARCTAQQLKAVGVNVNFAPVADINTNKNSYLANMGRMFSADPQKVSDYVIKYINGHKKEGVIACLKHFPGYGDVNPDPHKSLPVTNKTYDELLECELIPYINAFKKTQVDMLMTAHIAVPKITGSQTMPATIAAEIMDDILRNDLEYDGVIVTDDVNMGGIPKKSGIGSPVVQCINAGVDIVLFVGREKAQKNAWEAVYSAVKSGEISMVRLNKSVERILALKYKYAIYKGRYVDINNINSAVNTPKQRKLLIKVGSPRKNRH
ncbi:MAG: hypothetical protein A2252_12290 [Elusimicrobia bacterium RIFOXYA2_FULL_39_19]|nr:MAG: hypothetical protein A2252_12290 [Elusimicrobia bacterium RIFOXYA2_FULL_39_19]